jgi:hypothetical protein
MTRQVFRCSIRNTKSLLSSIRRLEAFISIRLMLLVPRIHIRKDAAQFIPSILLSTTSAASGRRALLMHMTWSNEALNAGAVAGEARGEFGAR